MRKQANDPAAANLSDLRAKGVEISLQAMMDDEYRDVDDFCIEYTGAAEALIAAGVVRAETLAPRTPGSARRDEHGERCQVDFRLGYIRLRYRKQPLVKLRCRPGVTDALIQEACDARDEQRRRFREETLACPSWQQQPPKPERRLRLVWVNPEQVEQGYGQTR